MRFGPRAARNRSEPIRPGSDLIRFGSETSDPEAESTGPGYFSDRLAVGLLRQGIHHGFTSVAISSSAFINFTEAWDSVLFVPGQVS